MVGSPLRLFFDLEAQSKIIMSVEWFKEDTENNRVFAFHDKEGNFDVYIRALRDDDGKLIGFYSYHEYRTPESGKEYDLD